MTGLAVICGDCLHPRATHYFENTPEIAQTVSGPCHATVYTEVSMGMNATRCKCTAFALAAREAEGTQA